MHERTDVTDAVKFEKLTPGTYSAFHVHSELHHLSNLNSLTTGEDVPENTGNTRSVENGTGKTDFFLWNVYRAFFLRFRIMISNKCTSVCLLYKVVQI
jgi:hypothetical protein